jgi:hypothetical protein
MAIKNLVTSGVGRQVLTVQKHSPVLLLGAGLVGMGATIYLSCTATLKVEEVLKTAEERKQKIAKAQVEHGDEYTEEDAQKDGLTTRVKLAIDIAKLYAPAVGVGVLTVVALTGSYSILNRRNIAATAAFGALQQSFSEYRDRVKSELGDDKDLEFRFGVEEREVAVDTDEGVAVKTIRVVPKHEPSGYAKWFDESSPYWQDSTAANRMFLMMRQNHMNDLLVSRGHVFLNEVYDQLGIPRTEAGQFVGWVLNGKGDGHIDFNIFNKHDSDARAFINELNGEIGDVILLDFNVDGPIFKLIEANPVRLEEVR